ncbi:acyl-CoA dehydrogenase [Thermobifida fusca]|mgnify:FL=1|jgi:butyryl-CoA dehydrogenase|uniref:Butyryl-CoA dehydrogenase n=3 Tax=Thermobifida fusca TaxID=2021 RepID=Q47QF0_THEFY|nr:acyl-CoA dehydrogenase family protein [Thermobifida fusca]AAZ55319.1 butyryl-CoA dehydrogenase [Thermobifida fusca YX]MDD6791524.1 acyl-CoA dehydrogenase family protein [Thermobifida fusca]PPS93188.1 butyryl-CoA dehydrogenase [Thermobifida fusca]PZN62670.1 MAG: butyryl-CoA dehydrogenase [Thermobifida fusca]QOS57917.1 acyl-CoA dehydrogenase family protein [Thermobifida fusca]
MTARPVDEYTEIRELASKVAREVYGPIAEQLDVERKPISREERIRLGELGFLGIAHQERYGGAGAPLAQALAVIEEFARVCRPAAFQIFEANTGPAQVINYLGTEEQRERWLPDIISGEKTMAVAISEPDAGSAATDMRTTARPSGDGYVITGTKRWISNGGEADLYLVYARLTDEPGSKGIGALVVEKGTPGLSFGPPERLMGFRGIPSADVILDEVWVPKENLVVPAGGFGKLFGVFSIERLGNTTMSLGIGQEALDRTIAYVQEREQFGKPLIEFQSVQITLADMVMQVDSARLLQQRAAASAEGGKLPDPLQVSLAKCAANEMAKRVTDMAMQLHGGNGYTEEYGIERLHRDAHGWAIAGGTPNMQRIRIVSELLGRKFNQRA